ncbi:hypothetical protein [Candidatus Pelagibacter sp. HIMB1509]|uniref:hypothetical protein n=1 Tax=Candidatus Pelagibacter sp. HIMB1509 TaxID=3413339 RepID=UPI003F83C7E9
MKKFKIILIFFIILIPSNLFSEISYNQILEDPTNLDLNLQYLKEQETKGNYKAVIATLERLSDIYSDNLDLKLYLLSISLKIDSKERTKDIIDQIKRSPTLTTAIRQRLDKIVSTLEAQDKQQDNEWVQFIDIGYNTTLENNVNTKSDSNSLYISDSLSNYATDTIDDDDYQNIGIKYGAYKQLSDTSNINFNVGKAFTRQNRDKNKENDAHSLFVNYNKQIDKNYISTFYTLNENNNIHESDYVVHSLIIENRFGLKPNQNVVLSGNYSLTDYRTDNVFTAAEDKNNEAQGLAVGYEYFINQNNNIKFKYGFNDYNAKLDSYGYDNEYLRISYSTRVKTINFNIAQTINYNTYDKADTFVKSDTIRDDEIKTNSISMSGSLNQLLNYEFLKNIFYSASYSEIRSKSNILNYDYNKDIFKFGLTKRITF